MNYITTLYYDTQSLVSLTRHNIVKKTIFTLIQLADFYKTVHLANSALYISDGSR